MVVNGTSGFLLYRKVMMRELENLCYSSFLIFSVTMATGTKNLAKIGQLILE